VAPGSVPAGTSTSSEVSLEELALATRNHGMPLEALRYDTTPVGLHYLLIHYDIPVIDPASWRLQIGGTGRRPHLLGLDELRRRPQVTRRVTMECAGNGRARLRPRTVSQPWLHEAVGTGDWTGPLVADLLDDLGIGDEAREAVFTGVDRGVEGGIEQHYQRGISLAELRATGAMLAHTLNGAPLPPQHGAPLRLVVPSWYGMTNVKWLHTLEVVDRPFEGYQHVRAYRTRQAPDDVGDAVSRMAVRSLLAPPGIPEFLSRRRIVERGDHELEGRAWSGAGAIATVEVSTDGGESWQAAALEPSEDPASWSRWTFRWKARTAGDVVVCCRATDATGTRQPDQPRWNLGGYAVNAVHRVPVTVR
jgi:sulfane dehydrogenase subunit SoxC